MQSLVTAEWAQIARACDQWLSEARGAHPPAVVLGGSVNGLSFVRSLARRGIRALMLDSDPLIGMQTRRATAMTLPPVDRNPELWTKLLIRIGEATGGRAVLFVTSDVHMVFLAEHEAEIARALRFVIPAQEVVNRIVNKRLTYAAAAEVGVPIPKTLFPSTLEEVRTAALELVYPCILKPYKAHLGHGRIPKKVLVVNDPNELVGGFARVSSPGVDFMIQEIIPGADSELYGYLAFWDRDGHEAMWLTKRKLRQNPPHFGDGSLQISVEAPEVATLSRRLLGALGYRGFVGVEFKRDARDGTFRLMEINPRTVSGNQLAIAAGVDFPWAVYRYLTGDDRAFADVTPFVPGVRYVNEEWDFKAFLELRRGGNLGLREWLGSIWGAKAHAVGAWDDPGPLMAVIGRFARAALQGTSRQR